MKKLIDFFKRKLLERKLLKHKITNHSPTYDIINGYKKEEKFTKIYGGEQLYENNQKY
jgi:hypothetical protein